MSRKSDYVQFQYEPVDYYPDHPIEFSASNDAADGCSGRLSIKDAEELVNELNAVIDKAKGIA